MAAARAMAERLAGARPPQMWLAALLIAAAHGAFVLAAGIVMSPDSLAYASGSARMIELGFDYPALLAETKTTFPPLLYVLFGTLLALLRIVFGDGWPAALVALNLAAHIGLAALLVRLAVRLTGSGLAGWGALLLFLGCFDLLAWIPYVLSDSTFVFLAFGIFTLAAARILGERRRWLPVLAPAALAIFYRPTGMVLIPDLLWAFYLSRTGRAVRRAPLLAALAAAAFAAALAFAWFMQDPSRWPLEALSGPFRSVAAEYARGEVVGARPETYHSPPAALADYLLISADRFLHFFAIGAAGFSFAHWVAQLAFFLPAYGLAGWLAVALWRGRTAFGGAERKVFLAAFGAILSYALFHALVQVDFDWRYRVPVLPHLILLAAGGLADLLRPARAR